MRTQRVWEESKIGVREEELNQNTLKKGREKFVYIDEMNRKAGN